jgi:hypothetical protein
MVDGIANRETELGGEGVAVCHADLASWVLTPISGEWGHGQEGMPFFFGD